MPLQRVRELLENPAQGVLEFGVEPTPPLRNVWLCLLDRGYSRRPVRWLQSVVTGRDAWLARTRRPCSKRRRGCSRHCGLTASVTGCSGIS